MTFDQFRNRAENGNYDNEYAEYLMTEADVPIGNGEMLIRAVERDILWDDFLEYQYEKENKHGC